MRRRWWIGLVTAAALLVLWSILRPVQRDGASAEGERRARSARGMTAGPMSHATDPGELAPAIAGSVFDHGARPLASASVCARPRACFENVLCADERCATTSQQGTYALSGLSPGSYELSASAAGYVPQAIDEALHVDARTHVTNVDFTLEGGTAAIRGVVRDATGGVVPEATVLQVRADGVQARARTTSDSEGKFELSAAPGPVMLMATADGYAAARRALGAPASDVSLTLTPEARVSGIVVTRETGEPVADVVVEAEGASNEVAAEFATTRSGADGRFAFKGLVPGAYRLQGASDDFRVVPAVDVSIALTDVKSDVVLRAEPARTVRGELSMRDGSRCATWGRVSLQSEQRQADGRPMMAAEAMARVPPGEAVLLKGVRAGVYRVRAACGNYPLIDGPAQLEVKDAPIARLRWRFGAAARVLVRARDTSGKAIRDLALQVARKDTPAQPIAGADTDAKGIAELTGLEPGDYLVQAPLLASQPSVEIHVPRGQPEVRSDLIVAGSTTLRVRVLTERGEPFAGATVIAEEELSSEQKKERPPNSQQALALGDGVYEFHPISAGGHRVMVLDDLNAPAAAASGADEDKGTSVTLRASEPLEIKVTYGGYHAQIQGRIVDAQGAGVANAWIEASAEARKSLYLPPGAKPRVYSDEEGNFTIEGLRTGSAYDLRVEGPDGSAASLARVSPGDRPSILLPLAARLSGTLTDLDGRALSEFAVQVDSLDSGSSRAVMFRGTGGKWELQGIAPGRVLLQAGTQMTRAREALQLAPGEKRTNLALVLPPPATAAAAP